MAMHCQEASERMSLAADRMLTPKEIRELEEHLETCDLCQQKYRALGAVDSLLADPWLADPPADMSSRVMHRIRIHKHRRRLILAWARGAMWVVIAAATVTLVTLAIATAREALEPGQSLYADVLRSLITIYQLGISIARGIRVILAAFLGQTTASLVALYAALAGLMAMAWVRLVTRGEIIPIRSKGN